MQGSPGLEIAEPDPSQVPLNDIFRRKLKQLNSSEPIEHRPIVPTCLFGTPDAEATEQLAKKVLGIKEWSFGRHWNFDMGNGKQGQMNQASSSSHETYEWTDKCDFDCMVPIDGSFPHHRLFMIPANFGEEVEGAAMERSSSGESDIHRIPAHSPIPFLPTLSHTDCDEMSVPEPAKESVKLNSNTEDPVIETVNNNTDHVLVVNFANKYLSKVFQEKRLTPPPIISYTGKNSGFSKYEGKDDVVHSQSTPIWSNIRVKLPRRDNSGTSALNNRTKQRLPSCRVLRTTQKRRAITDFLQVKKVSMKK